MLIQFILQTVNYNNWNTHVTLSLQFMKFGQCEFRIKAEKKQNQVLNKTFPKLIQSTEKWNKYRINKTKSFFIIASMK